MPNSKTSSVSNQLIENIHYYFNESGLMVFTEAYHLERGFCCGNGCLHCPYNFEAVEESRRKLLLKQRADSKNSSQEK